MRQEMDRAWLDQAVHMTQALWRAYVIEPSDEGLQFILASLDPEELSLIGTGKHEFYRDFESFLQGFQNDQAESQGVTFEILDEYYEARQLGSDSCIVFGTLWVREKTDQPKPLLVERDTRFTLTIRRVQDF